MNTTSSPYLLEELFSIQSNEGFEVLCWKLFRFQAQNNEVYRKYIQLLGVNVDDIHKIEQIPFMPIEFFKTHDVKTGDFVAEEIFTSSGTTGINTSRHFIKQLDWYEYSFKKGMEKFYGDISSYCYLALLPSYLERTGSSLITMVDSLIKGSQYDESGFYLYNHDELYQQLLDLEKRAVPVVLFGVSFALLDFIEKYQLKLKNTIVVETGGMKGRKKEIIREELHGLLKSGFGVDEIHSEYGMTELLSQSYSLGNGEFKAVPWMRILLRDTSDPLTVNPTLQSGGINVIDLANVYSCGFIATQDLGKFKTENSFEVLGRFDYSDVRGCNLLI